MNQDTTAAKFRIFLLLIAFTPSLVSSQERSGTISREELRLYLDRNTAETRLPAYRDDDTMMALKLRQLHYINDSRRRNGVRELELDILASRVANRMAREAAENNFTGHWNMRGEKPYHRYSFAGGHEHVSENAAAMSSTAPLDATEAGMERFMRQSHDYFMAEKPPADGHRKTVIEPGHTGVGIGVAVVRNQARYYEEYIGRYLEFLSVPEALEPGELSEITVRPISGEHLVLAVVAYYEPPLKPLDPSLKLVSRSYPDYSEDTELSLWPWDLKQEPDGTWKIPVGSDREGLLYVKIYLGTVPFTSGSFTTKGKITASGIVIRIGK